MKQRRSIRKYLDKKVEKKLEKNLQAGIYVPNPGGGQGTKIKARNEGRSLYIGES